MTMVDACAKCGYAHMGPCSEGKPYKVVSNMTKFWQNKRCWNHIAMQCEGDHCIAWPMCARFESVGAVIDIMAMPAILRKSLIRNNEEIRDKVKAETGSDAHARTWELEALGDE